jgi:hypothetical protein
MRTITIAPRAQVSSEGHSEETFLARQQRVERRVASQIFLTRLIRETGPRERRSVWPDWVRR